MNIVTKDISVQNEVFTLTNQRVLFWKKQSALILSDLHIGKSAHFRKNGLAIPSNIYEKDLERLYNLIQYFHPKQLIIVGDLIHSGNNSEVEQFCNWKNTFTHLEFHLVEGNHDKISKDLELKLNFNSKQEELTINHFSFLHDFKSEHSNFQINGHIHPGILIKTKLNQFRLPCFTLNNKQLLLPAFSEFTGLDIRNNWKKHKVFGFTNNEIFEF